MQSSGSTITIASGGRSIVRSVSTTRASKVSTSRSQNGHSTKPARSSSLTRPSILNAQSSFSINANNSKTSILNTSIASITSRPSTPGKRSTAPRPSSSSGSVLARSQTPAKARPSPISPGVKTTKPHSLPPSCPSPTSQPQISTNTKPPVTPASPRHHSRSSTPTRKPTNSLPTPTTCRATSVGRVRNATPASTRPSSPSPRARPLVQPIDSPDFPCEAPSNLRTRLPERPASAGRMHPRTALTTRANLNSPNVVSPDSNRRHSLPVVGHSMFLEKSLKDHLWSNGHHASQSEIQKGIVSDGEVKRSNKVGGAADSTGFGRTISKKSLDMALRHMDIKQNMGGIRSTSLFPHSIRSNVTKGKPGRMSDPVVPVTADEGFAENDRCNKIASSNCNRSGSDNGGVSSDKSPQLKPLITREREIDLYGSSRYDAMLLKEDSNNMNWLHNVDDKSEQNPVFDYRFEPLPEPFGLL